MASAPGTRAPTIARLVAADDDTARGVIHAFNASGLAALDPRRAGGRPRLISDEDVMSSSPETSRFADRDNHGSGTKIVCARAIFS